MLRVYARLATVEAVRALARYKVRSALAILGVAVAVTTVIWVAAIGRAGVDAAMAQLDALGDNLIWIEAGSRGVNGVRTGTRGMTTLIARDADAIRDEVPLVRRTSENVDGRVQVIADGRNWLTTFRGVAPDYRYIKRWDLADGDYFSSEDVERARPVIVIGETVRRELFGDDKAVGERLRAAATSFTIVGVLAPKGQSPTGTDQDDVVMMPWTTAMKRIVGSGQTWLDDIVCSADSPEDMARATDSIVALLRERHHIRADGDDDFNIRKPAELIEARIKSSRTLDRLLIVIAAIALVVGGIGIMNVMLASVAQRTREIGVRVAIGARPFGIQIQFLGEAIVIGGTGGALGWLLAVCARAPLEHALGWTMTMSHEASVVAVGAAIAVGVLFGLYPAVRASRLDPIDALRDER